MTHSYVERELKFDVGPGFRLPDLGAAVPAGGGVQTGSQHLRSDYFDTADHALLRVQMTLRRRTGSTDVGWQLKIPHAPFREEIHAEPDGDRVPEPLQRLLIGVLGGQELTQIATVVTERSVTRLLDADGGQLAEIADDTVHASAGGAGGAVLTSWREIEVELGQADDGLLQPLGKRLRRAGARPSSSTSKLARALGSETGRPTTKKVGAVRAGDVIAGYLAEQQRVLLVGDLALRRGDDGVIHKTRVATRRVRSTLRVFASLFDPDRAARLDGELRWYAALLGEVRDRQVLQQRLDTMLTALDDTLLLGPVKARIDTELGQELARHWQTLQDEITGERYLRLLADLASFVRQPPHTAKAAQPAGKVIKKLVQHADRQVARKLRRANTSGDEHQLHAARKSAKRARYAAEAATPVLGSGRAAKQAHRYHRLQDLLGEHQDSLVSADLLRRLGAIAGTTDGESGFTFGILHQREQHNADTTRRKARKTAKRYN